MPVSSSWKEPKEWKRNRDARPAASTAPMPRRIGIADSRRHRSRARQHPSGLNENTGEFRVGENVIFGMANGNIKIRRSPQGDEVEVAETTLAGLIIDAFFTDKFDGEYDVVSTR
jgi:hypothetical protein